MRKVMSLLLVFVVIFTGLMPQVASAAEISSMGTTDANIDASLFETTSGTTNVQNYPMPSIYTPSSVYSLKVENEDVPVIHYKPEYDYAHFSFDGTVSIEITANEPITSYSISPLAKNIEGTVDGNKLTFTLSTSTYVIVDINEDPNEKVDESDPEKIRKRLVIAADPLDTDIPDTSRDDVYDVTAEPYNADNTGATMASDAIQQAIDDAHQAGGGTVFVPAGVYTSSNLTLKSNVDFYIAGGAVIVGTGKGEDYRNDFRKDSLSRDGTYFIRTEVNSENITIRGRGTIDGKGVEMRQRKMTDAPPTHKQGEGFINNLLVPIATSNFKFDGLILRDGGFWAFMVVRSNNVEITNYKVFQDLRMLENDGIDINESQNVLVKHAIAISDDDAYSTKTWPQMGMSKDWPGEIQHLTNVVFEDSLAWTRTAAFKLGMGICTPQTHVTVRNSYVYQSARALLIDHAFTSNPLPEEGYASNVTFENIDIERVGIHQFGNYWFRVNTSTSGDVSNVLFKNINVRETGGTSQIQGNPTRGGMVDGLTFSDVYVKGELATSLSDLKASVRNENVRGIVFANTIPPIFSDDFEDGTLDNWVLRPEERWEVITDEDLNEGKILTSGNRTSSSLLLSKEGAAWTDYTFEARIHPHLANGKENAGLVFRVQDENNYYMYRINANTKRLELYKVIDGTFTHIEQADTAFTPAKQWYTIKLVVQGNTIKAHVDDELMTTWTNENDELTTGGIGFRTTSANIKFDDVIVYAINQAPTDITLSNNTIAENSPIGSFIGAFSTEDPDQDEMFYYTLVEGEGDGDNERFDISILGNSLVLRTELDYQTQDSYQIRVRSTDPGGLYVEKSFTIEVVEVKEFPVESDLDNILYTDNFENGILQGWDSKSGNWQLEPEDGSNILVQKNSTPSLITLETIDSETFPSFTNFSFEADARTNLANANAGLVFRVQDSDTDNYYMYRMTGSNRLELYKAEEGALTLLASTSIPSIPAQQWYNLKVVVYEASIQGYLNGELQLEWTDTANEFTEGSIGFRTTSANTAFRNLLVTGVKEKDPATVADASKNSLTLDRSIATVGETVTLTATGDRQAAKGVEVGDEKYIPVSWASTEAGQQGSFVWNASEEAYTADYTALEEGVIEITASYQKMIWDGAEWIDGTTDTKTITLKAYDNILYTDNFASGVLSEWDEKSGNWRLEPEDGSNILVQKNFTPSLIILETIDSETFPSFTNFSLEVDARTNLTDANAGLVFRVQNSETENYYMYRMIGSNSLQLLKAEEGSFEVLASTSIPSIPARQWYNLKVVVSENSIQGYLNGELHLEWTDTANEFTEGSIGLRTTSANTAFRNLLVTGVKEKDPATVADAAKNSITLDRSSVTVGDTVTLIASGDRQLAEGAVVGDEKYIPVSWVSTEAEKASGFTVVDGVYSADYATSAAGQYTVTVVFQKQSWNGTEWIDETDITDTKSVSLTVRSSSSGGDNGGYTPTPPPTDQTDPDGSEDEGTEDEGTEQLGTITTTQVGDQTIITVFVDESKLDQMLSQEDYGAIVSLPVAEQSDAVIYELTGQMLESMQAKQAVLQLVTNGVIYTLPATRINLDDVLQQLGSQSALPDVKLEITVATPSAEMVELAQEMAQQNNGQLVVEPVTFKITFTSDSQTIDVVKFNGYVERSIALPADIDSSKVTTGIVLNADGTFSHVPTVITIIDGVYYANIKSLTNSTYAVIYSPKTFDDVDVHWARDAVNEMGSRLIVAGIGDNLFKPDRDISRSEFAAIIVRALGVMRPDTGKNLFEDVTYDSWYYDAVATANEYDIVQGYGDGTFGPQHKITREQAMTMMARAMKIIGLEVELTESEVEHLLSMFDDASEVADYARTSIALGVKTGIITGRSDNVLAPKSKMTRAEVAVMIARLLQKSGLI